MAENTGMNDGVAAAEAVDAAEVTAPAAEGPAWQSLVAGLEAELAEERARTAEAVDRYQRMAAEFQNSRRRQERQLADEIDRASAHLVRRLLPVVDDIDLAIANVPAGIDGTSAWVAGFRQIQKKLQALLEESGVAQIPAQGEFDPTLHEAIGSEPSETVPSGAIIAAVRAGYTLKGQVLRPALVRVAR